MGLAVIPPNAARFLKLSYWLSAPPFPGAGNLRRAVKSAAEGADIRREDEWKQTGIIEGAETITAFTIRPSAS